MANDAAPTGTKRQNCSWSYRNADGEVVDSFTKDSRSIVASIVGATDPIETKLSDIITDEALLDTLVTDFPMAGMAMLFGLKTTEGNALAPSSSKGWGPGEMVTAMEDRRNTIVEDKEWREGGGGGPRTTFIIDAMASIFLADNGQTLNSAGREFLKGQIKEKGAKAFTDQPRIAAEIAAAEARRAQEKLQVKQAAAAASQGDSFLADMAKALASQVA